MDKDAGNIRLAIALTVRFEEVDEEEEIEDDEDEEDGDEDEGDDDEGEEVFSSST